MASPVKLILGWVVLVMVSISSLFRGASFAPASVHFVLQPVIAGLLAPVQQDTSYPPPTQEATSGYPPQSTTGATSYPGPQTQTQEPTGASTLSGSQTSVAVTATLASGTLPITQTAETPSPTPANDIFLTENAEMGQSQATPLPTETPTPSATLTSTLTPAQPTLAIPTDQGFKMNWGVFLIGFFGIVVVGGAAGFAFLRKRIVFRVGD